MYKNDLDYYKNIKKTNVIDSSKHWADFPKTGEVLQCCILCMKLSK